MDPVRRNASIENIVWYSFTYHENCDEESCSGKFDANY